MHQCEFKAMSVNSHWYIQYGTMYVCADVEVEQVCEGETFKATCAQPDQVLFVQSAQYGRMSASRCLVPAATDCRLDVLAHLDRTCSGRQSCELKVSVVTDAVGVLQLPVCLRHARGYLEVTYTCLTGESSRLCAPV
jgi:hypothetical protein